jgi:hypothetical protein
MTAAHLNRSVLARGRSAGCSADPQHDRDDHPDADEASEHPKQEGSFADREPWQVIALEKEFAPTKDDAGRAAFNDLAADGGRRIIGDLSLGVEENARTPGSDGAPSLILSHIPSLTRFAPGLTSLRGESA